VIIGAGASVYYGVPTVNCFFSSFKEKILNRKQAIQDYGRLLDYVNGFCKRLYGHGLGIFETDNIVSPEELLSILYYAADHEYNFLKDNKEPYAPGYIHKLKGYAEKLILEIIETSVEVMKPRNLYGELHTYLKQQFGQITYLNFNYDTIIDSELSKSLSESSLVLPSYHLPFEALIDKDYERSSEYIVDESVSLLNLHGSFNILWCSNCHSVYLCNNQSVYSEIVNPRKRRFEYYDDEVTCKYDKALLKPLIIPPMIGKNYANSIVNALWDEAYKDISKADKVICIGYSFAESDFMSKFLMLRGLNANPNKSVSLEIVDPDEKTIDRISKIFSVIKPKRVTKHEMRFKEFLDSVK